MSVDYTVFTRRKPRIANARDIGPIAIRGPEQRDITAEESAPRDARRADGVWIMELNCHHSAAETAHYLAVLICKRSGGGWIVCDHHDDPDTVSADTKLSAGHDDVFDELVDLVQQEIASRAAKERADKRGEIEEWTKSGHDPGDDWSDV